jgi:hypothetical protein
MKTWCCDWLVQIGCAVVRAEMQLILGDLLEHVLGIGGDEGNKLDIFRLFEKLEYS